MIQASFKQAWWPIFIVFFETLLGREHSGKVSRKFIGNFKNWGITLTAIWVHLNNTRAFGHCLIFLGNIKLRSPKPQRLKVPICQEVCHGIKKFWKAFSWYSMEYSIYHLYFLSIHTCLKACVYTEKVEVTCGYLMVYQECQTAWQWLSEVCENLYIWLHDAVELYRYYTPFVCSLHFSFLLVSFSSDCF